MSVLTCVAYSYISFISLQHHRQTGNVDQVHQVESHSSQVIANYLQVVVRLHALEPLPPSVSDCLEEGYSKVPSLRALCCMRIASLPCMPPFSNSRSFHMRKFFREQEEEGPPKGLVLIEIYRSSPQEYHLDPQGTDEFRYRLVYVSPRIHERGPYEDTMVPQVCIMYAQGYGSLYRDRLYSPDYVMEAAPTDWGCPHVNRTQGTSCSYYCQGDSPRPKPMDVARRVVEEFEKYTDPSLPVEIQFIGPQQAHRIFYKQGWFPRICYIGKQWEYPEGELPTDDLEHPDVIRPMELCKVHGFEPVEKWRMPGWPFN